MPQQLSTAVENNFTKGLVSEYTGLNFPENAATDTDNCNYTLIGDVVRREGFNLEPNFHSNAIDRTGKAVNTYKWNNVAGQGEQQFLVTQVGSALYFWDVDASTIASPLSNNLLGTTIDVSTFVASGGTFDATKECQFSDGNGYLFVYHPSCDPFYCTFTAGTITGTPVIIQIRDFQGVTDGNAVNSRPTDISDAHLYNLVNQGWTQGAAWQASISSPNFTSLSVGSRVYTVAAGIVGVNIGDPVTFSGYWTGNNQFFGTIASGNVTAYAGTQMTVNLTSLVNPGTVWFSMKINPTNHGYINTWNTALGNYPSNADVWWTFKNTSNVFDPATQINNVTLNTGSAPKGHFLLNAFSQQRDLVSAISTIDDVVTMKRPRTGTWFQGRVWYTGVDDSQAMTGVANAYTWTENIYFSQIVTDVTQFGQCYQANDPTSETLFDLLPTDGGVIVIQGSGPIYKLFPIQNGMLVFAANGIWFITGSQGVGFSANDYTIIKLSAIKNFSSTSYVDVQGLPYFWNEDGIYSVQPSQGGSLTVTSITYTTIDTFYSEIPLTSRKFARGDYDPINYIVRWIYKDTEASDVTNRYTFNKMLSYNVSNKAFFPYTVSTTPATISSINYVSGPGGTTCPPPTFKHLTSFGSNLSFSDEHDTNYVDWASVTPTDYTSYLITGYKIRGQAIRKFQLQYLQVYSRVDGAASAYRIHGIWNYANSGNSGKWTSIQAANIGPSNFDVIFKRHKIRGSGYAMQFRILSTSGMPFDLIGWAAVDTTNQGT